jgi:hypothetical protein
MPFGRDGKSDIAERLRETAEDLMELVAAQVKLTRLELVGDARALGVRLVRVAIFLPLAVLGYGFAAAGGAYALGTRIGFGWSFALVGVIHAAAGGWGLAHAARMFRQVKVLDRSREELDRSIKSVAPALAEPASVMPPVQNRPPALPASSATPGVAASSTVPPAGARVRG